MRTEGRLVAVEPTPTERHWTVCEIGKLWHISEDTVRKIFENEPDVVIIEDTHRSKRRRYRTLRIPESVLQRVHRRLRNV